MLRVFPVRRIDSALAREMQYARYNGFQERKTMDAGRLVLNDAPLTTDIVPGFYCEQGIAVAHTTVEGLESIEFEFEVTTAQ